MLKRLRSECLIDFDIVTEGPMLIKSGQTFATGADMTAVRTMRNGKWEPYIPGSSIKGAIRAQAERIARTLARAGGPGACDPFQDVKDGHRRSEGASCSSFLLALRDQSRVDALTPEEIYQKSCPICKLFGSLSQAGRLAFNDAHLTAPLPFLPMRNNVAINRRTGGAAGGALFEMEFVPPTTRFNTSLYLRNFELWQLGLLAFVLRDFEEGIIKMGMGKSRGLGRVKANITQMEIRYLGLTPVPGPDSPGQLYGIKSMEPDANYGFAAYGNSEESIQAAGKEGQALSLYDDPLPANAVRVKPDDYGLRTICKFETLEQRQHLWRKVAPLWVTYIKNHPYS